MTDRTLPLEPKRDTSPEGEQSPRRHSSSIDHTQISSGDSHVNVQALSPSEARLFEQARTICKTLVLTDIGRDQDDMAALVVGSDLTRNHGVLKIEGVIATLTPAVKRTQLAGYTLKEVGLKSVPVGVGSDLPSLAKEDVHPYEFEGLPPDLPTQYDTASTVFERVLQDAKDSSLTSLNIAAFTDLSHYLDSSPRAQELFKRKVERAVIMGGVKTENGQVALNDKGFMVPDDSANYEFDRDAAAHAFDFFQTSKIPMTLVSRHAVYEVPLSRETLDQLAATGRPIGIWLRENYKEGFKSFWDRLTLTTDNPKRALPARCNRDWFSSMFCEGKQIQGDRFDWQHIKKIYPYDAVAMLACPPSYRKRFFDPTTVVINDTHHDIIGLSREKRGIKKSQAQELQALLKNSLIAGLRVLKRR